MPINSRTKGHAFERKIARALRDIWFDAKRGLQSRGGGKDACDVEGTPYHIECKRERRVNIRTAMHQANEDTHGRPPTVISQDDHGEILVTMQFKWWLTEQVVAIGRNAPKGTADAVGSPPEIKE